jgi:hypothetical protein
MIAVPSGNLATLLLAANSTALFERSTPADCALGFCQPFLLWPTQGVPRTVTPGVPAKPPSYPIASALHRRVVARIEGEIVGQRDHALVAEVLRRVLGERARGLRRGTRGTDKTGIGLALGGVIGGGECGIGGAAPLV